MPSHAASSGEWPLRESPGSLNSVMSVAMTSPEAPAEKSWRSRRLGYPLERGRDEKGHRIEPMTLMFLVVGAGFEPTTSGKYL